jgi:hypothetical protein
MQEQLSRLRAHIRNRAQNLPHARFDFTAIINATVIIVAGVVGAIFCS